MTKPITCGFCGLSFDPNQAEAGCPACPLSRNCHLVCCPRCGYQTPPEPKLIGWLRKLKTATLDRAGQPVKSEE